MRVRPEGRLLEIADAALVTFTERGLRRTQMAQVARRLGVSVGSLYGYVESKDAMFELALGLAIHEPPGSGDLPYRAGGLAAALERFRARIEGMASWQWLGLDRSTEVPPAAELRRILDELYGFIADHRRLIWLLDRCAAEVPELHAIQTEVLKGRYIDAFGAYVRERAQAGHLALGASHPEAVARLAIEAVVWMAAHRHRDAMPPAISEEEARQAALDMVVAALVPGRGMARERAAPEDAALPDTTGEGRT